MTSTTGSTDRAGSRDRNARLAAELRANLQRRKAQSRARASKDGRSDGPAVTGGKAPARKPEQGE